MHRRRTHVAATALAALVATLTTIGTTTIAGSAPIAPVQQPPGPPTDPVYGLAGGCFAISADFDGTDARYVTRTGDGYSATATDLGDASRFRLQAAQLGRFMFYDADGAMIAQSPGPGAAVTATPAFIPETDWRLTYTDGTYTAAATHTGQILAVDRQHGALTTVTAGTDPATTHLRLTPTDGCADFPNAEVNTNGIPAVSPLGTEVRGFIDTHVHMNAHDFIGGDIHCGAPFDPQGITVALSDCPDHGTDGAPALIENILSHGDPSHLHDTVGWPTFHDFPAYDSLTHEQTYYRWVERAWRGGLRIFTNLLVSNRVLCDIYWHKSLPCDEMETVRIQARAAHAVQDYVDAQHGGPGRGWFRIVSSPAEVRQVAAEGKLAVTLGIEISEIFGCREIFGVPQCTEADIDRGLDEVYAMGVRQLILIHKFDNALGGVRFDEGIQGVAINVGNVLSTGSFWQTGPCPGNVADNPVSPVIGNLGEMAQSLPPGMALPVYTEGPACNVRGLTSLGRYAVHGMMKRGMIVDIDHMSVHSANDTLDILEQAGYSGVVSSHSWTDPSNYQRILALGGFVAPYATGAESFVRSWRDAREMRSDKYMFGIGYGADTNGFGVQAPPSSLADSSPVQYPFTSFDGGTHLDRQRTGERVFDVNV
ncbi:MAG: peptidase, partial [Rhodococcus sp.]|nr:peptidase [Rhodococcus sp. (in: high G+C Gram-positive bacteria)]